jgi:methylated-DNA-[protein]-cysteine S-methyltransferase
MKPITRSQSAQHIHAAAATAEADKLDYKLHLFLDKMKTPLGDLMLLADQSGSLRVIEWVDHVDRMDLLLSRQYRWIQITMEPRYNPFGFTSALEAYFAGDMERIQSLPVSTAGTLFQRTVWQSLRSIPTGKTVSYGSLAKRLGVASAVRAVGRANGANPVSIVVPCHRVIGSDGSLTGYGGGLHRKRWLLEHEQRYRSVARSSRPPVLKPPLADPTRDAEPAESDV